MQVVLTALYILDEKDGPSAVDNFLHIHTQVKAGIHVHTVPNSKRLNIV